MRACLRCHVSLSLSGIDELMASALLWSVQTTAMLWVRGWWDAKSRYLSVCVDFLYTVVAIDPSGSRCNRTSRKGSLPSNSILNVNCMLGSTLFRWSRSSCNLLAGSAVHVSSTYCFQKQSGMSVVPRALSSTSRKFYILYLHNTKIQI